MSEPKRGAAAPRGPARLAGLLLGLALWLGLPGPGRAQDEAGGVSAALAAAAEEEAYAIALEAYLYGFPRVEFARRMHNETRRVSAGQVIAAPVNSFFAFDRLARPGDGAFIKAPNNDTLYASAWIDVGAEPVVLRVPEVGGRLYVALLVDAAGAVVGRLGSVVSGPGGVDHVFARADQLEGLPAGLRPIPLSGDNLWLLMRLATDGTAADERAAVELLREFRLAPLSERAGLAAPAPAPGDMPLVSPLDPFGSLAFFDVLAAMLVTNPVPPEDRGLVARWARIGLAPGRFEGEALPAPVRQGIARALAAGDRIIAAAQFGIAITVNGWNYSLSIGKTGEDWALNAAIARGGYGNLAEDSVYYQRNLDAAGAQLTGAGVYELTFPPGQLPPVDAFWSLTAYDQERFDLIENPIGRYSIGDRTAGLVRDADGGLTIRIAREAPGEPARQANWLPVGEGAFYLILRTYAPRPGIVEGRWAPPEVMRLR